MRGLFVSFGRYLERDGGGVQICTREYIDVIEEAGIALSFVPLEVDRRPLSRMRRLIDSSPHYTLSRTELLDRVAFSVGKVSPTYVFLNQASLAPFAADLRERLDSSCKIVLLSHGLESTDLLHLLKLRKHLPLSCRVRPTPAMALGRALLTEIRSREFIDLVCVLSPFDAELETWLGSKSVCWLPRRVIPAPLQWKPQPGRFGWVGTLDHSPNLEGLVKVLDVLKTRHAPDVRIRVVGGPEQTGHWLSREYPVIDYLGTLDKPTLAAEASTWIAFLNPIFCQARGCSTKLATALGWNIPIVTTPSGRRGYVWSEGGVIEAATDREFVQCCLELLDLRSAKQGRRNAMLAAETTPKTREISQILRKALAVHGQNHPAFLSAAQPASRWN